MDYELIERHGTAAELHERALPEPVVPQIWWHRVTGPALVLGSTQRDETLVDHAACTALGVEVVRRRSGGGAVLLVPGAIGWLDVVLPAGAPGWADDVHAPMRWIGAHLAAVFAELLGGHGELTSNAGPMRATPWSTTVCFDGVGPGEVTLDGVKLVGISQRRQRTGARLQCSWYHAYDSNDLTRVLAAPHRPPVGALQPVATVDEAISERVPDRLRARLRGSDGRGSGGFGDEMGNDG
ncbi:MAG: hypothetical protein HKN44_05310 [Ilumatobacter sp.]|nr:hypothetical protein [Ilumatobacter sp.]